MNASADQKARLLAAVRAEPSLTRSEVVRRDRGGLLAALAVTALVFLMLGGAHLESRPGWLMVTTTVVWVAIAGVATWMALRRGRAMLGTPRAWLVYLAVGVPVLLGASWFALPWPSGGATPTSTVADFTCFGFTLAFSAPLFVAFLVLRRDGDPIRPAFMGAGLGAAAGAWGAVLIDLHCERITAAHVVIGHLLPVACLAVVGALGARATLAVRGDDA